MKECFLHRMEEFKGTGNTKKQGFLFVFTQRAFLTHRQKYATIGRTC